MPVSSLVVLGTLPALQSPFGGDEGYEFLKAFMLIQGYPPGGSFWTDQPPLFTELVALAFRLGGTTPAVGRLVAVGIASLFLWSFYRLVRREAGPAGALAASSLLICSPHFLDLSASGMIELPAMAFALLAAETLAGARDGPTGEPRQGWARGSAVRPWVSAALFAIALQMKLTAMLLLPALASLFFRPKGGPMRPGRPLGWGQGVVWYVAGVSGFWALLYLVLPSPTPGALWASHFSRATYRYFPAPTGVMWAELAPDYRINMIVGLAIALVVLASRSWLLRFPAVALATSLLVHSVERPYWWYYDIHFSIPCAWLCAVGLPAAVAFCIGRMRQRDTSWWPALGVGIMGVALAAAGVVSEAAVGFCDEVDELDHTVLTPTSGVEDAIRRYHRTKEWAYVDDPMAAFLAAACVPPEVCIIPQKRWAAGLITDQEVLNYVAHYQPDVIALSRGRVGQNEQWRRYLAARYILVYSHGPARVFRKRGSEEQPQPRDAAPDDKAAGSEHANRRAATPWRAEVNAHRSSKS